MDGWERLVVMIIMLIKACWLSFVVCRGRWLSIDVILDSCVRRNDFRFVDEVNPASRFWFLTSILFIFISHVFGYLFQLPCPVCHDCEQLAYPILFYSFGSFSLLFTAFVYCSNLIQLKPYQTAPWWRRLSGPSSPCLRLSLLCPPSPARLHLPRFPRCYRVRKRVVNVFYSEPFVFLDRIHFSMKPGTHQPYDGYVASTGDSLYHSLSSA